jgi:hypothetical protein
MLEGNEELLAKLDKLQSKLDHNEKYPGVSCSKAQDGCFQNFLSARECPAEQICQTVDENVYRCKTASIFYNIRCKFLFPLLLLFILVIVFSIVSYLRSVIS